jgi:quinol monooxygenase YgiN
MLSARSNIVRVVARAIAKPDQTSKVKVIVAALMKNTRLEVGCLRYDVLHNKNDPTDFTTLEEWSDQKFLDAHFQAIHYKEAIDKLDGLLQCGPDIRFYHPIN